MDSAYTKVAQNQYSMLRDRYRIDWPSHFISYFLINHAIRNSSLNDAEIYTSDRDLSDGSFIYVSDFSDFKALNFGFQ